MSTAVAARVRAHGAQARAPTLSAMAPSTPRRDIEDRADCERLVRAFYGRAMDDPMIGFFFVDVARLDLEAHVPVIASFWDTILLGGQTYSGGAFAPHISIHRQAPIKSGHFERWLTLWSATVDELFAGPRAELAKAHAQRVARAFHRRLEGLPFETGPGEAGPGLLTISRHGPGAP
jgi:hemoglobin